MASPQKENGHTGIANEILDQLCITKLNGTEHRVILFIIRRTYGFQKKESRLSISFISKGIQTTNKVVEKALKSLGEQNMIKMHGGGFNEARTISFNKDYESWGVPQLDDSPLDGGLPQLDDSSPPQLDDTGYPPVGRLKKEISLKKSIKEKILSVFEFWKSKNIVNHRKLEGTVEIQIKWKLATYSEEELIQCISNYAAILQSDEYLLDTKWGLDVFLMNHFEKFLTERNPFSFYPKIKPTPSISQSRTSIPKTEKKEKEVELYVRPGSGENGN